MSFSKQLVEKIAHELTRHNIKIRNRDLLGEKSTGELSDPKLIEEDIHKSDFVLICVCERYRLSYRCQAEAKYAFTMNKQVIPLIVQEGFESVSGWLGNLINTRQHVSFFHEKDFEQSMHELYQQLRAPSFVQSESAEDWRSSHVAEWLRESKIHGRIVDLYKDCDGAMLKEIYLMSEYSPEMFNEAVFKETDYKCTNGDIRFFSQQLKALFLSTMT